MAFQCIYGCSDVEGEDGDGKEGSKIPRGLERMEIPYSPSLLHADDLLLCGESQEELGAMVGRFVC